MVALITFHESFIVGLEDPTVNVLEQNSIRKCAKDFEAIDFPYYILINIDLFGKR